METGETAETPFSLDHAERVYQEASEQLFGISDEPFKRGPYINFQDEAEVRLAVEKAVKARLDLAEEKKRKAGNSVGLKGNASIFDYEKEIATCERALDVLGGRRTNTTSLISIVTDLANEAAQRSQEEHIKRDDKIRRVGFLHLGPKDPTSERLEKKRFEDEQEHISSVISFVKDNAQNWARTSQTS